MKKFLLLLFVLFAAVALFGVRSQPSVEAQKFDPQAYPQRDPEKDLELAAYLKRVTNRESGDLVERSMPGGGYEIDLQERFQNVMMARLEPEGEVTSACVGGLEEAHGFLGRDLATGELRERTVYPKTDLAELAARHGMSVDEYLFYRKMAGQFAPETLAPQASTITIVNNDGAGEGFNDPTPAPNPGEGGNNAPTHGTARLAVFNQAAAIWGGFLDSNVPTQINAQFNPLFCDAGSAVLGTAGTTSAYRDFPGAPAAGTWYHYALANKLFRSDLNGTTVEINATFNSNINGSAGCLGGQRFYYGFDNATPFGTTNLLVVVLHEMGHGLGFSSLANSSTGALLGGFPDTYIRNMYDRTTGLNWAAMSDVQRQASAINPGNVLWDGASVKSASATQTGGREASTGRLQLYTPNPLQGGSSVSHWDTAASPNLLMEPAINLGLSIDLDLTRQQMRDIGWHRDTDPSDTTRDAINSVAPSGGAVVKQTVRTISWNNLGGFNRNVTIELSTDGGATYSTAIATDIANTGSYNWTVPNITAAAARVRVREHGYADLAGASSASFAITAAPTAARVFVAGRVSDPFGRAVSRAVVTITDAQGNPRSAVTNSFGYFRFDEIDAGQTYVVSAAAKRYTFTPQVVNVSDNVTDLYLTAR